MKLVYKIFLLTFCTTAVLTFPQPTTNFQHPGTSIQYPDTSIQHPDYRNHINLPEYDPSLMPLKTVRTGTGVWTELNPKVPRVDYLGIHFINKDTGWACGANGVIIKTTNGGMNWSIPQSGITNVLTHINSYNGTVVNAVSLGGKIVRSSDQGESWVEVASGTTRDLWRVQMLNDTLGWISGTSATLLKTTNAGESWQTVTTGFNLDYWSLDFLNERYGMIACGSGKVLKTTDGGNTWIQTQAGDTRELYTIDVIDTLHMAAGGGPYGKNVYSSNGGVTWTQNSDLIFENGVNCISFINADTGYAIGENWAINKTENGGVTWWASDPVYAEWWLNLLPNGIGYAAGNALRLYKTSNGYDNWEKLFLTDNINDVHFIDENKGFIVVRDPAKLYKTTNSGISWDSVLGAPGGVDLLFLDNLTGFLASDKIYKTTNGGNSWYQTNSLGLGAGKFFFISKQIGWATASNRILKSTDEGENWFSQVQLLGADSFTSIFFLDSLNGWATSRYIWQTTNGGTNWIQRTDVPAFFCDDVFFSGYFRGWIIAGNELYATNNGGNSWALDPQVYTYSRNFETISNTHFIITGTNIYESTDTGHVWQNITNITGGYFTSLHAPKEYVAYGVGTGGFIVQYFDSLIVPVELSQFSAELKENMNVHLQWITESEKNNLGFEVLRSVDLLNWDKIGFVTGIGTSTSKSKYTFIDNKIEGSKVYYRLKQLDYNGHYSLSEVIVIEISVTNFFLSQNFPNPANPSTCITFTLPQSARIKIELYTVTGEKVKEILDDEKEKGIYKININLNDLSSGIYFYTMRTNSGYTATKKLILIK